MKNFSEDVEAFIKRNQLVESGDHVAVAVSGGIDSMALLQFFVSSKEKLNITVSAIHVDHMLRGAESFEDLQFVRAFCAQKAIPFIGRQANAEKAANQSRKTIQEAARHVRYQVFLEEMKKHGFQKLATAHHADDQLETVLMQLTRGSHASMGIPISRPFASGMLIRPFLAVDRKAIQAYSKQCNILFREDPSNNKLAYTRNRFRHKLVPFIQKEHPKAAMHVQRFTEEKREDELFLRNLAEEKIKNMAIWKQDSVSLEIQSFHTMPLPLQRRAIHLILNYLYQEKTAFSFLHIQHILQLLQSPAPSGYLNLPSDLIVRKSGKKCLFVFEKKEEPLVEDPIFLFKDDQASWRKNEVFTVTEAKKCPPGALCFKLAETTKWPICIRTRKSGDRIKIKGMKGSKKLTRLFIDEKVPADMRDFLPVVTDAEETVLWVPSIRKSVHEGDGKLLLIYEKEKNQEESLLLRNDIEEILISEEEIQKTVQQMGAELTEEYRESFPLFVCVLKGAMPFMSDLIKRVDAHVEIDFMDVSSYGASTVSSGEVKIVKDLNTSVEGRDVIIVEDIIDSGLTLSYLAELFHYRKARSVKIVTLLDKPTGRKAKIKADKVGFTVPDAFVVGYGLDYAEKYRNLPYVGVLKPEIYTTAQED